MNILHHRSISRRTMLRAAGVSLALPWLEAMQSPLQASADTPPLRTVFIFAPNGMHMPQWTPAQEGPLDELPPLLESLRPHRGDFSVLSRLANMEVERHRRGAMHAPGTGAFLTCVRPVQTPRVNEARAGVSVDQLIARHVGASTRLPSLELSVDTPTGTGQCDNGYACVYTSTISWRAPTAPVDRDISPRSVFERLFGDGTGQRGRDLRARRSILDFVQEEARGLNQKVGQADRAKLEEYLESVREVERRVQAFERNPPKPDPALTESGPLPIVPPDFASFAKLMMDLLVIALATDSTRVGSLMLGVDISNRNYPEIGVRQSHHETSHHGNQPGTVEKYRAISRYLVTFFGYFLERMKAVREGERTLLDRSQVLFGSSIGDGNKHNYDDLPILLAGKGDGTLQQGVHRRFAAETPIANLYLTMLRQAGCNHARFGDSTGALKLS